MFFPYPMQFPNLHVHLAGTALPPGTLLCIFKKNLVKQPSSSEKSLRVGIHSSASCPLVPGLGTPGNDVSGFLQGQ